MVFLGRVLQEQLGEPLLAWRRARRQDRPFQRANGALELRWLLRVDLDAESRADLADAFERGLLRGDDRIDLTHAKIGEKV